VGGACGAAAPGDAGGQGGHTLADGGELVHDGRGSVADAAEHGRDRQRAGQVCASACGQTPSRAAGTGGLTAAVAAPQCASGAVSQQSRRLKARQGQSVSRLRCRQLAGRGGPHWAPRAAPAPWSAARTGPRRQPRQAGRLPGPSAPASAPPPQRRRPPPRRAARWPAPGSAARCARRRPGRQSPGAPGRCVSQSTTLRGAVRRCETAERDLEMDCLRSSTRGLACRRQASGPRRCPARPAHTLQNRSVHSHTAGTGRSLVARTTS